MDRSGAGFVYRSDRELLDAVLTVAAPSDLRAGLALRARQAYERFYNEERYTAEYFRLIEQITTGGNAHREEADAVVP